MSIWFTSRRNIERLNYLVLTDGKANGHLTLDLSGTRGMGFHTLRHQTSSLRCHVYICLLAIASLGLLRTAELAANNVFINIIVQIQASCETYIAIHGARSPSVAPGATQVWCSHINHNIWCIFNHHIWCIFNNNIFSTRHFPCMISIQFCLFNGSISV